MPDDSDDGGRAVAPPHAKLIEMVSASWVSHIVYAAAKLGLCDRLDGKPQSAAALAGTLGVHAPSLTG